MARLPRIVVPEQPLHVMHRGNNRQDIFKTEDDMIRIKNDIEQALSKSDCALHAYVVMSNHLHLLITPKDKQQLSMFMQTIANRYVRYYNAINKRTGTIWEGRFKSCLVDSDNYLFTLYKYIEMNPVKANMVDNIADYKWSSYQHNALGETDKLITEPPLYKALGDTPERRYTRYRDIFNRLEIGQHDDKISKATLAGDVYGSQAFHDKISSLIARPTQRGMHGGDRKSEAYKNQVG